MINRSRLTVPVSFNWIFCVLLLLLSKPLYPQQKPNVLFMIIDDLNDWVDITRKFPEVKTPNLDRLAARGTYFTKAYSQAPLCGPSRASFLSGVLPSKSGVYLQIKDTDLKSYFDNELKIAFLPNYMSDHGYTSLGVGKVFHNGPGVKAFDEYGGKFDMYGPSPAKRMNYDPAWFGQSGTQTDWGAFPANDSLMTDYKSAAWAVKQLNKPHEKPFFMTVGFIRPHVPWHVPQKWYDKIPMKNIVTPPYKKDDMNDIPEIGKEIAEVLEMPTTEWAIKNNKWKEMVHAYISCIAFVDAQVGKVLDALDKSPYARNTYVILVADHGYHLGEKNRFAKHSLWERSAHVPMIISGPGLLKNTINSSTVGLIDIYPTILDLCKLPANKDNNGRSLLPLLKAPSQKWDYPAFSFYGTDNVSIYKDNMHYIRYENGTEELYNLQKDPNEWNNIANTNNRSLASFRSLVPAKTAGYVPYSVMEGNAYFRSKK